MRGPSASRAAPHRPHERRRIAPMPARETPHSPGTAQRGTAQPGPGPCDGRTAPALHSLALHSGHQSALHRRPSRRQCPHGLSPRAPVNTFHSSAHPVIPRTPITPQLPVEMVLTWGNTHVSFIHTVDNAWGKRYRPPVEPQARAQWRGDCKAGGRADRTASRWRGFRRYRRRRAVLGSPGTVFC